VRKLAALALVLTAACGYSLAGSGLDGVSRVAIRTPSNDSTLPGVEYVVADALRREVLRRDGAALTEDAVGADLVVSGAVRRIASRSRAFSSAILAREHELELELRLEAVRRDGSRLEVPGGALRETDRFLASADIEAQRKNQEEALHRIASVLAARFFDSVSEALAK
jgi:hypothetical protein